MALIEKLWDEKAICVNAAAEYCGWQQIGVAVKKSFDAWGSSGHRFRQRQPPLIHHRMVRFAWEMVGVDGQTAVSRGTSFITLSDEGRILSDHQFVEA